MKPRRVQIDFVTLTTAPKTRLQSAAIVELKDNLGRLIAQLVIDPEAGMLVMEI